MEDMMVDQLLSDQGDHPRNGDGRNEGSAMLGKRLGAVCHPRIAMCVTICRPGLIDRSGKPATGTEHMKSKIP